VVILVLAAVALSACAGDDDSGAVAGPTVPPATTASTAPVDYRGALVARLSREWDDPGLAEQVVAGLDDAAVEAFEARVALDEVADHELLSYDLASIADDRIDSIVAFAFGYRDGPGGTREPGPANEAMAAEIARFVTDHPVPVFAQTEIAELLGADGVADVTSIDPVVGPDGQVEYLSTAGVAEQVVATARGAGVELGTVGIVCFADHLGRCVLTARAAGMDPAVPEGIDPPRAYDPGSAQPWTTARVNYLATDLRGRLATG